MNQKNAMNRQPVSSSELFHHGDEAMNTMSHKGYTARFEHDGRDDIFVGRLLGMRTIIGFHAATVIELQTQFVLAIEDYLAECKADGIQPEHPA